MQPLPTEKPAHRHGNSASNRENTALVNKKRVQRAGNKREKSQKQLRPSHDNDEGRKPADTVFLAEQSLSRRPMRKNKREKGAMANRQRGCTAEERRLRSRRNAEGAEMRGLKRQTGGADGRSNAVGRRRNVLETETRRAELYGRWRAAVSRRKPAAPAPLLSIINLARALSPTAGAFSLCSLPHSLQWHNSSSARPSRPRAHSPTHPATSTPCAPSSQPLYRVLAPFAHSCGMQFTRLQGK